MFFQNKNELTCRNVCGQAVPRETWWFHRQPTSLFYLEKKGLWVVWYNSDMFKIKAQGREIRPDRIQICVRVVIVLLAVELSAILMHRWK